MNILDQCVNMLGNPLSKAAKKDIKTFLDQPNADNWNAISGICITKSGTTIWQAVCKVYPNFPKVGRKLNFETGEILAEWSDIPTPFDVLFSINRILSDELIKQNVGKQLEKQGGN